ncbi:uncharacterized protein LOC127291485 [Leptopilina boulardi]|uniref:uncharacterized protein LOC127291485 n=1 Tax=Leptopilina boulardi TaxID=63433 RepID=UPI0021F620A7|nr:uncharacterized protein LOC127291485 [Leptopilina boulardi]
MNLIFRKACLLTIFLLGLKYQCILAQNRIIGGSEGTMKKFPYMLYMQIGRKSTNLAGPCGASIISKDWGLTAAHCFSNPDTDYDKIFVIGGTADLNNPTYNSIQNKVSKVIVHELFKGVGASGINITADIALIKFDPPLTFNDDVKPAKLPSKSHPPKTDYASVSGWGNIKVGGPSSDKLLYVTLPKVDREKCKKELLMRTQIVLKPGEICYGYFNATTVHDKCQGDSGGPLVNSDRVQLGIVSWGIYCGTSGIPGVYTDVRYFRDWIKQKTGLIIYRAQNNSESFAMNFTFRKICLLLNFLFALKCQVILSQNRIIGGDETSIEKFPYMLRLQIGRKTGHRRSVCSAAIIGKEWGITAAHCFDNPDTDFNKIRVIAGTTDIKALSNTAEIRNIIKVIRHELYEGIKVQSNIVADIAVIKFSPPFNYNNVIQPVKLPERGQPLKTDFATITGWGDIEPGGPSSATLRFVNLPKINTETCRRKYLENGIKLRLGEICYGVNDGTVIQDKCQGDSGGPLVNSDNRDIGIISWGISCGTIGLPGIYTDILFFRDWIKSKTGI